LFREFALIKEIEEDRHDERMVLAWMIAGLSRQTKLPRIETLLSKRHTGPQTVGQLKGMLQQLSARYGIPLRKAKGKSRA